MPALQAPLLVLRRGAAAEGRRGLSNYPPIKQTGWFHYPPNQSNRVVKLPTHST